MSENVVFKSGHLELCGKFTTAAGPAAAVITHPHPLYGGDMDSNVVIALENAFLNLEVSVLRFNFRGVGASGGVFDNGIGEQEDVLAAMEYIEGLGKKTVYLAGYSFGTWVIAAAAEKLGHPPMFFVAPPVALLAFTEDRLFGLKAVIAGENDTFGPPDMVFEATRTWNPEARFTVIPRTDHFFWGKDEELESALRAAM